MANSTRSLPIVRPVTADNYGAGRFLALDPAGPTISVIAEELLDCNKTSQTEQNLACTIRSF